MSRLAKFFLFLFLLTTTFPQFAQQPMASTIDIGGTDVKWGIKPEAAVAILRTNDRYSLIAGQENSQTVEWTVIDKALAHVAFTLHFDRQRGLVAIDKSWTPAQDRAIDFATALYDLISARKWGNCLLVPEHTSEPQSHWDIVHVVCEKGTFEILAGEANSTDGTVRAAHIYEKIEAPSKSDSRQ